MPVRKHYAVPVVSFAATSCHAFCRDRCADRNWETRDNVMHRTAYTRALLAQLVVAALVPSNSGTRLQQLHESWTHLLLARVVDVATLTTLALPQQRCIPRCRRVSIRRRCPLRRFCLQS